MKLRDKESHAMKPRSNQPHAPKESKISKGISLLFDLTPKVIEHELVIPTPEWALCFYDEDGNLKPSRYKGAKGGRGSGKSVWFADMCIEKHIEDPNFKTVCIREIQKSIQFSVRQLIVERIREHKVEHLFDIKEAYIKRIGGEGIIIFMGMQDHTADSVKSLQSFDLAWVEEAQNLSAKSLKVLRPTIRNPGSELWFTWNPYLETDPVDRLFAQVDTGNETRCILTHVNYNDNPFLPLELLAEAEDDMAADYETYLNVWLGEYLKRTDDQIFGRNFVQGIIDEEELTPENGWEGPFFGMDFGYINDPSTLVKVYRKGYDRLYVQKEWGEKGVENDLLAMKAILAMPEAEEEKIIADSSEKALISQLQKRNRFFNPRRRKANDEAGEGYEPADYCLPRIEPCEKWPGSVNEGIKHMQSYKEIVVHPECKGTVKEMKHYKYKVDKITEEVTDKILENGNDHYIDAIRYSLGDYIQENDFVDLTTVL